MQNLKAWAVGTTRQAPTQNQKTFKQVGPSELLVRLHAQTVSRPLIRFQTIVFGSAKAHPHQQL